MMIEEGARGEKRYELPWNICGEMNRNEEKCQAVKGSYEKIGAKLRSSESGGELVFLNFEYGGRHPDVEKRNKQAEKDLYAK